MPTWRLLATVAVAAINAVFLACDYSSSDNDAPPNDKPPDEDVLDAGSPPPPDAGPPPSIFCGAEPGVPALTYSQCGVPVFGELQVHRELQCSRIGGATLPDDAFGDIYPATVEIAWMPSNRQAVANGPVLFVARQGEYIPSEMPAVPTSGFFLILPYNVENAQPGADADMLNADPITVSCPDPGSSDPQGELRQVNAGYLIREGILTREEVESTADECPYGNTVEEVMSAIDERTPLAWDGLPEPSCPLGDFWRFVI